MMQLCFGWTIVMWLALAIWLGHISVSATNSDTGPSPTDDDLHTYDLHAHTQSIPPQDLLLDSEVGLFVYRPKALTSGAEEEKKGSDWLHIDLSIYNHPDMTYYVVIRHEVDIEEHSSSLHETVLCSGLYYTKDTVNSMWSCGIPETALSYGDNGFLVSIYNAASKALCLHTNTHVFYPKDDSETVAELPLTQVGGKVRDQLLIPVLRNRKVLSAGFLFFTTTILLYQFHAKQGANPEESSLVHNSGFHGFDGDDFGKPGHGGSRPWYYPLGIDYYAPVPALPSPVTSAPIGTSSALSLTDKKAVQTLPSARTVPLVGGVLQRLLLQAPVVNSNKNNNKMALTTTAATVSTYTSTATSTASKFFTKSARSKPTTAPMPEEDHITVLPRKGTVTFRSKLADRIRTVLQRWKVTPDRMRTGAFLFTVAVLLSRTNLLSSAIGTTSALLSKSKLSIFGRGKQSNDAQLGLPPLPSPSISSALERARLHGKPLPDTTTTTSSGGKQAMPGVTLDRSLTVLASNSKINSNNQATDAHDATDKASPKLSSNAWKKLLALIKKTLGNMRDNKNPAPVK